MKFNYLPRFLTVISALLFSLALPLAHAQYKQSPVDIYYQASDKDKKNFSATSLKLFTGFCVANMSNMGVVREQFKSQAPIPNEIATQFLGDLPGKIWAVKTQKQDGAHMFALADQVYHCAIYSLVADVAETERLFDMLKATTPEGSEFALLKNEKIETSSNGTLHTKAYTISIPGSSGIVVYTLNSFSAPQRGIPQTSISITIDKM